MRKTSQKGSSAVEILFVSVVGAVLISMAVPAWQSTMRNYRLSSSSSILAGELDTARTMAISRATPYRVLLVNGTIQIIDVQDPGNPPKSPVFLEEGVGNSGTTGTIVTFFPRGTASAGTFNLEDESGDTMAVQVLASGKIAVVHEHQEVEPEA